jgi:queuine tRNA-ribosyltransferase
MFEVVNQDGKARKGKLTVKGKVVETPFFMPVATKGVGKFVSASEYNATGTKTIITNAFLIYLGGIKGDLHKFMGYNEVIFTDNGGFQMIRDGLFLGGNDYGVFFKNPYKDEKVWMSPRKSLDLQWEIDSDVTMAMDYLVPYGRDKGEYVKAMEKSHAWTKKCKELHDYHKKDCLIFGINQGGVYSDLRKESAKYVNSLGFDGYSIGGLGIGETDQEMFNSVKVSLEEFDVAKPKYLMGVGDVKQILECVSLGVDIFDSILPQKHARHGQLFTMDGLVQIFQKKYEDDEVCIEQGCDCEVCKTYSRKYLRYLYKKDDAVFKRLATVHNMRFMVRFMEAIRESIVEGKFSEFKDRMQKVY